MNSRSFATSSTAPATGRFFQLVAHFEKELGAPVAGTDRQVRRRRDRAPGSRSPAATMPGRARRSRGRTRRPSTKFFDLGLARSSRRRWTRQGAKASRRARPTQGVESSSWTRTLLAARVGDALLFSNKGDSPEGRASISTRPARRTRSAKMLAACPQAGDRHPPAQPGRLALGQPEAGQGIAAGQGPVRHPAGQLHPHRRRRRLPGRGPPVRLRRRRTLRRQGRLPPRRPHARRPRGDGAPTSNCICRGIRRSAARLPLLEPKGVLFSHSFYLDLDTLYQKRDADLPAGPRQGLRPNGEKANLALPHRQQPCRNSCARAALHYRLVAAEPGDASPTTRPSRIRSCRPSPRCSRCGTRSSPRR